MTVDRVLLALLGASLGAAVATYAWRSVQRSLGVLLASILVIPYWVGISVGAQIPVVVGVVAFVLAISKISDLPPLAGTDLAVAGLVVSVAAGTILGRTEFYDSAVTVSQWALPYVFGRVVGRGAAEHEVIRVVSVFAGVLAALAIVEFALDWHPFVDIAPGTNSYVTWSQIQVRAGLPRSEWTFGHSIALGNVLALAIPFVLLGRSRFRMKLFLLALILGGVAVTFSRNAIVAAVVAVLASLLLLRQRIPRHQLNALFVIGLVFSAVMFVVITQISSAAGSETAESNAARQAQLSLAERVKVIGISEAAVVLPDGSFGFLSGNYDRGFTSTLDNTPLLLGLRAGWIPVFFWAAAFAAVAIGLTRGGPRSAASVAVVAQIPTLVTAASITQYAVMVWLVLGIAVGQSVGRRTVPADPRQRMRT